MMHNCKECDCDCGNTVNNCNEQREYLMKKIMELKKYYLANLFSNIISKKRIDSLLNTNKPYDSEDLKELNINSDGLVDFDEYLNFPSKNNYMLCLPINAENSNYWIELEIDSLKNNKNISLKIRLDPLVKNPTPIIYKMTVFGEQLNWKKLSQIKEKKHCFISG